MLRQLIIWLMKTLLDLSIMVSLIAGAIVIAMTATAYKNIGAGVSWMLIAEIALGALGLVAVFGLLSLLIEINENLIRLRQTPGRRLEPQI
jgi:nitrate reductase gamma subunit